MRRAVRLLLPLLAMGAAPQPEPVRFAWFAYRGADPTFDRAGPAEYANPVLPGFHPDPTVLRVGRYFYLVTSTFTYFPGLPVFRSRDLVHWTQIGNAIDRAGEVDFTGLALSRGLFAPALHYARGRFYIINTCVDCGGTFIVSARDPAGRWSDPVWIKDVGGIDPSLFTDTDGTTWLLNNDAPAEPPRYEGHRAIWIRRFDLETMRTIGAARVIVNGGVDIATKPIWAEGPHLLRHDGHYYLTTAEGGTAVNHSEVVYRGDRPYGPFTARRDAILTQRDLDPARADPITSAGHAQLVDTPRGDWWATFLAVRPYAGDLYNTGRETFLLPVTWRDGWPVITRPGDVVPYAARAPALPADRSAGIWAGNGTWRDEFAGDRLAHGWLGVRVPRTRWWRVAGGALELIPRAERIGDAGQPSFLGRRQQHLHAEASTELTRGPVAGGGKAGLVAYQDDSHYYFVGVVREGGRRWVRVERRAGKGDPVDGAVLAAQPLPAGDAPVRLRVAAGGGRYSFDYALARGAWTRLLDRADGTVLSTAKAGGFTGVTLGVYAYAPAVRTD